MARLNSGEDYNGRAIDAETSFFIGVAVNPAADDIEVELERWRRKLEAGAQFAMTQIVFDMEYMDRFVERIGGEWPIPVMVGIFPVWSHQLALRLHNEVPGIVVPEKVLNDLRDAGPSANEVGMELGRRLLEQSRERADGAYLVAPFRQPLGILDVL
jgi:homocysteine S-methyltransferase